MFIISLILVPTAIGNYNFFIYNKETSYSSSNIKLNNPPENVSIEGPINGKAGTLYNYSFYCDDPEGDDVNYYIKWGIPSCPAIYGTYPSSSSAVIGFAWENQGRYNITFKAVDIHGAESDIISLFVTMPHNIFIKRVGNLFLQLKVRSYFEKYSSYV
jgi:hypothetical protein